MERTPSFLGGCMKRMISDEDVALVKSCLIEGEALRAEAKIYEAKAKALRKQAAELRGTRLAEKMGVDRQVIYKIAHGVTCQHIEPLNSVQHPAAG